MAATSTLPQLMAAALLNATVDQPGWWEGRKIAGRSYAEVTGTVNHFSSAESLSATTQLNRENIVRVIDGVVASLQTLRNDIVNDETEALTKRLKRAQRGRDEWWRQRLTSDWVGEGPQEYEAPKVSDYFGQLLGMRRKKKEDGD